MAISPIYYFIAFVVFTMLCIVLAKPLRRVFKVVVNSFFGVCAIMLFNTVGGIFGVFLGLNAFTAVTVGLLGIPGFLSLFVLKFLLG